MGDRAMVVAPGRNTAGGLPGMDFGFALHRARLVAIPLHQTRTFPYFVNDRRTHRSRRRFHYI
jgi:hypothetical protein